MYTEYHNKTTHLVKLGHFNCFVWLIMAVIFMPTQYNTQNPIDALKNMCL